MAMTVKERQLSLFGTKISFSMSGDDGEEDQAAAAASPAELLKSSEEQVPNVDDFSASTSGNSDDEKIQCIDKADDQAFAEVHRTGDQSVDNRRGKGALKRPDNDNPVPCPRCNSLDTKFCYFNNYNVNQPRHFCKNCQRYWTAGGALRNVPVGAGRRKNKSGRADGVVPNPKGDLHHHEAAQSLDKNSKPQQQSGSFSKVISAPAGKGAVVPPKSSIWRSPCSDEVVSVQHSFSSNSEGSNDSRDDSTCGSSVSNPAAAATAAATQDHYSRDGNSYSSTWPFAMFNGLNRDSLRPQATVTTPACPWQGLPWPGAPVWCPPAWTAAWTATPWGNLAATAATAAARAIAGNVGSALGKHTRDSETETADKKNSRRGPVWAPKTLRIDAQRDGCRTSSFLADIGRGSNRVETISTGGMFKAFQQESSITTVTANEASDDAGNSDHQLGKANNIKGDERAAA